MPLEVLSGYRLITSPPPEGLAIVSFDLDNVLNIPQTHGDIRWQQPEVTCKDPATPLVDTIRLLMMAGSALGAYPVIVTNREATRERVAATISWLNDTCKFFPTPSLYMRQVGVDHLHGLTHKAATVAAIGSILHIDDNTEVIHALQSHEVACFRFDSLLPEDLAGAQNLHFDILRAIADFVSPPDAVLTAR